MFKRVFKILVFLIITGIVIAPATSLLVKDDKISEILQDVPIASEFTDVILEHKKLLASTIINYVDDTLFNIELILIELLDDALLSLKSTYPKILESVIPNRASKKVVIHLPNRPITKPQWQSNRIPNQPKPQKAYPEPKLVYFSIVFKRSLDVVVSRNF